MAQMLRDEGEVVLDADAEVHSLLSTDEELKKEIRLHFGPEILSDENLVIREKLAKLVFQDQDLRLKLEELIHPRVRSAVEKKRRSYELSGNPRVFYDVPLLFEKRTKHEFDLVVLVYSNLGLRKERLKHLRNMSEDQINARLASQISLEEKIKLSDYVIENNGTTQDLRNKVKDFLSQLDGS